MTLPSVDQNILFGIMGVKTGAIDVFQLHTAFQEWVQDKSKPLAQLLIANGAISEKQRTKIEAMVIKEGNHSSLDLPDTVQRSITDSLQKFVDDSDIQLFMVNHKIPLPSKPSSLSNSRTADSLATGRFRIIRPHAKGGIGEVFVAHDEELDRQVALKQIQKKFAENSEQQDRFLREAEITGKLEHPGIVPVYGLGSDDNGYPFYVMRFIKGSSLREAIQQFHENRHRQDSAEQNRGLRKLLGWFIDVCEAMAYAHSRGVLHRDLKPGNIMLGRYGETLIVDWGLARTAEDEKTVSSADESSILKTKLSSGSAKTMAGTAMGTPAYMSPEQAQGRLDDLSAKSDVYSMGATLFSLLTGQAPVDGSNIGEVLEKVRAGNVRTPRSVNPDIPIPLNAVCTKAMSLRPADRYPSSLELAADIEAWLADAPVTAYPDPWFFRLRRWAKHHQTSVTATAAAVLVLAASASIAAILLKNKNTELTNANSTISSQNVELANKNVELEQANNKANQEAERARTKALTSARVTDFLVEVFEVADRSAYRGNTITAREVLDYGAKRIDRELKDEPQVQSELMSTMGRVYQNLGLYAQAEPLFNRSLEARQALSNGNPNEELADSLFRVAELKHYRHQYEEAERAYETALTELRKLHGEKDHESVALVLDLLGRCYRDQGKFEEAKEFAGQSLKMRQNLFGNEHVAISDSWQSLGMIEFARRDMAKATPHIEKSLDLRRRLLGPEHPDIPELIHLLSQTIAQTDPEEAEKLARETLELSRKLFGEIHQNVGHCLDQLAVVMNNKGELEEAEKLYNQALEVYRKMHGEKSYYFAMTTINLGTLKRDQKDYDAAEKLMREALSIQIGMIGEEHMAVSSTRLNIGWVLQLKEDYAGAESEMLKSFAIRENSDGLGSPATQTVVKALIKVYELWEKPEKLRQWQEKLSETEENQQK